MCHVIFIPYGIKSKVDLFLTDLSCQKFRLKLFKEGEPEKFIYIQGSVRLLPFGVVEYVFPREYLDHVLTTLNFHEVCYPQHQGLKLKIILGFMRKFLMAQNIPKKFKKDETLIIMKDHVSIIPIGIRKDGNLVEPPGAQYPGWTHEAI